jgi:phosphoribosylformimino-5-aminoimidazole carboxamide ribotide isomerase
MIRLIPSISISGGKMAKISANSTQEKWYDKSPLDLAMYFEDHGIEWIHFVDLDGATKERMVNYHTLQILANYTGLRVNYSGGIRTDGDIQTALDYGAKTITAATVASTAPDTFMNWMITYGAGKLILGIDQKDGFITTRGWRHQTTTPYQEQIQYYADRGIQFVKCTDTARDGLLEGPNFDMYQSVRDNFPDLKLVASGGVRSVEDIRRLNDMGLFAVIMARSLYEDRLHLDDLKEFLGG